LLERCCYGEHCITVPDCDGGEGEGQGPCEDATDCDDGDPCTEDLCDAATGGCTHTVITGCEGEGEGEGEGDAPCETDLDCDDGDPCTDDRCDPLTGDCIHTPIVPCDGEGEGQHEGEGEGAGCESNADCDDSNPCTEDLCNPATGACAHIPIQGCEGEGEGEGEPLICDVLIACPQQAFAVNTSAQICLSGDVDCAGSDTVYRWYKNNVLVTTTFTPCLTFSPITCADAGVYTCELIGSNGTFTTGPCKIKVKPCKHTGDPNNDGAIVLSELLRVIQFYNSTEFHCDDTSEDGFAPGPGDKDCNPHSSDYNPQDWKLGLSELLRSIQFYNAGGYVDCPDQDPPSEDDFCVAGA
jgi:hypothetical protein